MKKRLYRVLLTLTVAAILLCVSACGAGTADTAGGETSSGTVEEPVPCTEHTWQERYGTVEHASKGEMRQVQVGTTDDVYICNACDAEFGSESELQDHFESLIGDNKHPSAYTIREGGPVYENQWVVTEEAWTETIVTGYECTTCGAVK